jgi:hypothetical protein
MGFSGFGLQHPLCKEDVGSSLISPQSGLPQPSGDHGFFRLQPTNPLYTEEVGSNLISPQRRPGLIQPFGDHGFFRLQPTHPLCTEEVGSNLISPQRRPGLPQSSGDYGFSRLHNPHPHRTEEVGWITSLFRDTLASPSHLETKGFSGFSLRTLTVQKRLVEFSQSSETPWQPSASWRPWANSRGWFNLNSPQRHPGLPQPSRDQGFFRLQPPHPLCTEEVGST